MKVRELFSALTDFDIPADALLLLMEGNKVYEFSHADATQDTPGGPSTKVFLVKGSLYQPKEGL